jgi:hypothetical protein
MKLADWIVYAALAAVAAGTVYVGRSCSGRVEVHPAASEPVPLRPGEMRGRSAPDMIRGDGESPRDAVESYP